MKKHNTNISVCGLLLLCCLVKSVRALSFHKISLESSVISYVEISPNEPVEFELDDIEEATGFVSFQAHHQQAVMNVSLTSQWDHGSSTSGSSVGVIAVLPPAATSAVFYVNVTGSENITALVIATPYNVLEPVPGGCNIEFPLELDPNMVVDLDNDIHTVRFAYANVAHEREDVPPDCESSTYQTRLSYTLYEYFLPAEDMSEMEFIMSIAKMLTVDSIKRNARKVQTFTYGSGHTDSMLSAYRKQGVVYVVIVSQLISSVQYEYAAYTPAISYACSFKDGSCYNGESASIQALTIVFAIIGLYLCFLGHRFFTFEMFVFGFLALALISYVLIGRFTNWHIVDQLWVVTACGLVGGGLWLSVWVFKGSPTLSVLLPGFILGYILTATVFTYSPLGQMAVFLTELSYGAAFACGVLLFPVILMVWSKTLNIVSCSVVGSYLVILLLDVYMASSMRYLLLNALRKATNPSYIQTRVSVPYQSNDYILTAIWAALVLLGITTQFFIEKDRPDFPPCPYRSYMTRRHRRRLMDIMPDSDSSGSIEEGERTPLIRTMQRPPPPREEPVIHPL